MDTSPNAMHVLRANSLLNQTESPLLRLPAELRTRIWELVLSGFTIFSKTYLYVHGALDHTVEGARAYDGDVRVPHFLALTVTCRQIHSETALLPYSLNTFGDIKTVCVLSKYEPAPDPEDVFSATGELLGRDRILFTRCLVDLLEALNQEQLRAIKSIRLYRSSFYVGCSNTRRIAKFRLIKYRELLGLQRVVLYGSRGFPIWIRAVVGAEHLIQREDLEFAIEDDGKEIAWRSSEGVFSSQDRDWCDAAWRYHRHEKEQEEEEDRTCRVPAVAQYYDMWR